MPAAKTGGPRRSVTTAETRRVDRLRKIGEVLRLHEQLTQALGNAADADLERLAAASRASERAMGDWASRIEAFLVFKQGYENGTLERSGLVVRDASRTVVEPKAIPFLWEVIAFVLGFGVSLLLT